MSGHWGWNELIVKLAKEDETIDVIGQLKKKHSLNGQDGRGKTALMYAAIEGAADIVEKLVEAKAQPDIQDKDGRTALMYAAEADNVEIVKAILKAKPDPTLKDNQKKLAISLGGAPTKKILGEYGRTFARDKRLKRKFNSTSSTTSKLSGPRRSSKTAFGEVIAKQALVNSTLLTKNEKGEVQDLLEGDKLEKSLPDFTLGTGMEKTNSLLAQNSAKMSQILKDDYNPEPKPKRRKLDHVEEKTPVDALAGQQDVQMKEAVEGTDNSLEAEVAALRKVVAAQEKTMAKLSQQNEKMNDMLAKKEARIALQVEENALLSQRIVILEQDVTIREQQNEVLQKRLSLVDK